MDAHIENREYHETFMRAAIKMAEDALHGDETPVGCVFVHDGQIVGRGMNDTNRSLNGTAHCEFIAIRQILETHPASFLQKCDVYVTVEPCIMCAAMLRQFKIHAVYFGCANERFGGTGGVLNVHSDPSIDPTYPVYGGMFREEAIMLLRRFYVQENDKAPEPHKKANRELKTDIVAHKGKANKISAPPAAMAPSLVDDMAPIPAVDAAPSLAADTADTAQSLAGDMDPTLAGEAAPTLAAWMEPTPAGEAAPTPSAWAEPTSGAEAAPPLAADEAQSSSTDTAQCLAVNAAQSFDSDTPPSLTADMTQSLAADTAQSFVADTAQSFVADTAPSVAAHTSPSLATAPVLAQTAAATAT